MDFPKLAARIEGGINEPKQLLYFSTVQLFAKAAQQQWNHKREHEGEQHQERHNKPVRKLHVFWGSALHGVVRL